MIEARGGQIIRVFFPDDNHAGLYDLGRRIEAGEQITQRELQRVVATWRGFAQHDPEAGAPFASWRDVPDFAADMLWDARETAASAATFGRDWCALLFYVDPEALARYIARYHVPEDRLAPLAMPPDPPRPSQVSRRPMQLSLFD